MIKSIFRGRLNRVGFLLANLYWGLLLLGLIVVEFAILAAAHGRAGASILGIFLLIVLIAFLLVTTVVSIGFLARRFHDIGQTGWLALLTLIPGASSVLFIVLLILPGTPGANAYGDGPQKTFGFRDVSGL